MFLRTFFPLIFIVSLFDGFFSNLFYPSNWALLAKDILIVLVYFLFFMQEHVGQWFHRFRLMLGTGTWLFAVAFVFLGVLQIFNPLSPGLIVGLLGFKVMFLYWALALLGCAYADNLPRVVRFLKLIAYCSVPINLFGLWQFVKGPEVLLEHFGMGFERAITLAHLGAKAGTEGIETFLRVIATFASTGQYSAFLGINAIFCFALLFLSRSTPEKMIWSLVNVLNFVAMLAAGGRTSLVLLVLTVILFIPMARRGRQVIGISLLMASGLYFGFSWLGSGVKARYQTLQELGSIQERTFGTTLAMFSESLERYPMGKGMGSASPATRYLSGMEGQAYELVEDNDSKIQIEMGLAGVVLFYGFIICLLRRWFATWLHFPDPDTEVVGYLLTAYCVVQFTIVGFIGILDHPPGAVFLWALFGIVMGLSSAFPRDLQ